MTNESSRGYPFVERRSQQRPVAHDRRHPMPPPRRRRPRGHIFAVEMSVGLLIVAALTAVALPSYSAHERQAHDVAAESDLHNAMYVIEVCSAVNATLPLTQMIVVTDRPAVPCPGESLVASPGAVLTYLPGPGGMSFVLLAHNTRGRPVYWCWDQAMGGPIRAVASELASC